MELTHRVAALAAFFGVIAPCAAQVVSTSLTALTPLFVQVTSGAQTAQNSQPPGALPPFGNVAAAVGSENALATWSTHVDDRIAFVQLTNAIVGTTVGLQASGVIGPHEILVQFSASGPAPAALELSRVSQVSPGLPWPTVDVDLGNDGSVDLPNLGLASVSLFSFGAQPYAVRVILAATMPSNGISASTVQLTLRPQNNVVYPQTASGCAPFGLGYGLDIAQSFLASGIVLTANSTLDPMVLVIGFSQQPFLLPSSALGPCLVVPSLDVLLLPPAFSSTTIPLPAQVRPVTFEVQAVGIAATGLLTTDAFSVFAF